MMDYVGGDYFVYFFKNVGDLTELVIFVSFYMIREYDGREFMVSVSFPVICGKKQIYVIEVDGNISFQYVLGFGKRSEVDNLRVYSVLKSRPNGLLGKDVIRKDK